MSITVANDIKITSQRARNVSESQTLAIGALAKKMKQEGKEVIDFSAGEPDFDTPEHIKDAAIDALANGKTKYTPATGTTELKEEISNKLHRQGPYYTTEQIVVTHGAKSAIYNTLQAIIDPGDIVLYISPYWLSYYDQVRLAGGTPLGIQTDETTGFKELSGNIEYIIDKINSANIKALILNYPCNPTGATYTKNELEAIALVAKKHNLLIISDEIYQDIIFDGREHTPIASLSDQAASRTITIGGVSKSHAMTGWRIGWTASCRTIAKAIGNIQSHTLSNPATPCQWAALKALSTDNKEVDKMKDEFQKRRDVMYEQFKTIPQITCMKPQGAFYMFPNISYCIGKETPHGTKIKHAHDVSQCLLKEKFVATVPGSPFGSNHHIRLSFATNIKHIEEGMKRIKTWVYDLKQ